MTDTLFFPNSRFFLERKGPRLTAPEVNWKLVLVPMPCKGQEGLSRLLSTLPPTACLHMGLGPLCPQRDGPGHWPWGGKRKGRFREVLLVGINQYMTADSGLSFAVHSTGAGPATFQLGEFEFIPKLK